MPYKDLQKRKEYNRNYNKKYSKDLAFKKKQRRQSNKNLFLAACYRSMRSRVKGVSGRRPDLYKGLPLCDRETFIIWALFDKDFNNLWEIWQKILDSDLTPSINRKDNTKGYTIDNMEWVTWYKNRTTRRYRA